MMGRRALAVKLGCLAVLAACSVGTAGLATDDPPHAPASSAEAGAADGAVPDDGGSEMGARDGAAQADAADAADAAADAADAAGSCGVTSEGAESATAFPSTKPKVLDGLLDDWGCQAPLEVSSATAEAKANKDGGAVAVSARVKIEWDLFALYFSFDVADPQVEGTSTTDPSVNDSAEIYLRGSALPNADYGLLDHHFLFDYKNFAVEHLYSGTDAPLPLSVTRFTRVTPGVGYVIEARVDRAAIGFLFAGRPLGLDLQVNDGTNQATYLVWAMTAHGACGTCTGKCCCVSPPDNGDFPVCDALRFGKLTLK